MAGRVNGTINERKVSVEGAVLGYPAEGLAVGAYSQPSADMQATAFRTTPRVSWANGPP